MWGSLISNLLSFLGGLVNFQSKKLELNNTPEIKKSVINQKEENFKGKVDEAIKEKDVKTIRNLLSE